MKNKIFLVFTVSILFACSDSAEKKKDIAKNNEKVINVKVVTPQQRAFSSDLQIIGNALANKHVLVHALEGGAVSSFSKDIGDVVSKGEVLAQLYNPQLSRELEINKASSIAAESNYLRFKNVFDKTPELTTIQEFEKVKAVYLTESAKFKASKIRDSLLTIRAPFSGVITKRNIELGAIVQSGVQNSNTTPLFELMDIEYIRLSIALPETEIDNISLGMEANVSFSEITGKVYNTKVSRLSKALNSRTKTMEVQLDINNKDLNISPGMYANVSIKLESSEAKFSLPTEALLSVKSEFYVFVVEDNTVTKLKVKKGLSNNKYFEVLSNNIDQSTKVIIEGKSIVKSGMKVNPVN
tara:strand:- start:5946 stop:7007 length:1062 start_codon:yes stop_codon:yes gene_type:complete